MDNEIVEQLANYAHKAWIGKMKYMLEQCRTEFKYPKDGCITIHMPCDLYDRWLRQLNTSHNFLTEEEKESNRVEARKILSIIDEGKQMIEENSINEKSFNEKVSQKINDVLGEMDIRERDGDMLLNPHELTALIESCIGAIFLVIREDPNISIVITGKEANPGKS